MPLDPLTNADGIPWDAEEYAPAPAVMVEDPAEDSLADPVVTDVADRPLEDPERPEPEPLDEDDYAHEVP